MEVEEEAVDWLWPHQRCRRVELRQPDGFSASSSPKIQKQFWIKKHPQDKKQQQQQQQKMSSFLNVTILLDLNMVTVKTDQTVQSQR